MVSIQGANYYNVAGERLFSLVFLTNTTKITHRDFRAEISSNSVRELKLICKYLRIRNRSQLRTKNDLVQAIVNSRGRISSNISSAPSSSSSSASSSSSSRVSNSSR